MSTIQAVMFKSNADFCKFDLRDGLEVVALGKITIYKERSNYQLIVESLKIGGEGELLKIIEERKNKLEKEGLFDISRKRIIPRLPKNIGLITSESGAAIHDVLARLKDRTPINISLYPVLMQGKNSPQEIIQAIRYFNNTKNKPQILVITRGGGSIEDLMAFNDEELVREVANSKIPTISAIGHEVDWTLIDYASDLRLPTPTSVAEHLTISKEEAYKDLKNLSIRLYSAFVFENYRKDNKINSLFFNFVKNKTINFLDKKDNLNLVDFRCKNLFRIKIEKYKYKNNTLKNKKIELNKSVLMRFKNINTKMDIINLKLKSYENKYPILKNLVGDKIKFRKELDVNKEYILKFPDGDIKIKIIN